MEPVSESDAVALLRRMVEIPSPSGGEGELAAFLVDALGRWGFTAHRDVVGNAIGVLDRGPGPSVMLLGHMDTVAGVVPVRLAGGRLFGRGTVDAKGPLGAMICAAAGVRDFRGRITVVAAVEEETPGSRGAMAVRAMLPRPDALIVGEPSGWSTVVLGYKGQLTLRYRVRCPATHPSSPAPKATELAARAWADLLALLGPGASHGSFDRPAATLTSFHGDLVEATASFSVRTPIGFDAAGCVAALRDRVGHGVVEVVNVVEACRVARTDLAVRALWRAIRGQGGTPSAKVKTATSDMNTLAEVWDVPMATYGPGDSALDHADDEHIVLADYCRGIRVLSAALTTLSEVCVCARR